MQSKLILNNTEIKFRMVPHRPEFHLYLDAQAPAGLAPVVELLDAALYIRKVTPAPSILLAHARALATASSKYPYIKTEVKTHTLVTGVKSGQIDNVFNGNVPSRLTIGLTRHSAYTGDYQQDALYFGPFGLTSLTLSVDGETVNGRPMTFDFTGKNYVEAYVALFRGLGVSFHDVSNGITYEQFATGGRTLFCYDLTDDHCADDASHVSLMKNGVVRIELRFATALTHNVTVVMLSERDALLEIDERRNVLSTE
jgi:hypothetical protein